MHKQIESAEGPRWNWLPSAAAAGLLEVLGLLGGLATKPSGAVGSSTPHPSEYLMVFEAGMIHNRAHNQARLWIRPQWIRKTKKENDRGVR